MKLLSSLVVAVLIALFAAFAGWQWLSAVPEPRTFAMPGPTHWKPVGLRTASLQSSPAAIPVPDAFHTMHASTANSDEIWSAVAPVFKFDWIAEPDMYVAEGPTYDNAGGLYFSPSNPREDVSLVALDRETGKRRWSIPGRGAGCGAPLVLNDPDHPGTQLIYHSTYTEAMALRPDGTRVWSVPNGLVEPAPQPGVRSQTHVWGMNYHPQADAVFAVTMDGWVTAHDRKTGTPLLAKPFQLPGVVPTSNHTKKIPDFLVRRANAETDSVFGKTADGLGLFTSVLDVIYGNGVRVANFYAIDPNSGSLFIAATAPDEQDGKRDGAADNGALYRLELSGTKPGDYQLTVVDSFYFQGGTGSTPTVSADGELVVVSDDNGNVIVLDKRLKERWRIDVGDQVAASIAVSANNNEMYAITARAVVKLMNNGDSGSLVWRATLDAYPGFDNFNALTPTITANGIVISIGGGRRLGKTQILSKYGMGLLDRDTGKLRWFSEGREESISVTSIGPDGGIYVADSPIRRAVARGLFGDKLPPLVGGIQRYKPMRHDLLARDAVCAAGALAQRMLQTDGSDPRSVASRRDDLAQIGFLVDQTQRARLTALKDKEMTSAEAQALDTSLTIISSDLNADRFAAVAEELAKTCAGLEQRKH